MSTHRLRDATLEDRSFAERLFQSAVIVLPLVAVFWATWQLLGRSTSWWSVGAFLVMYATAGLGVTLGYHRLLAHASFVAPLWLRRALAVTGTLAGQGYFFHWIAEHRLHHACTDGPGDPHSPHWHGDEALQGWQGLWHAHVGWLLAPRSSAIHNLIPDLQQDRVMRWIDCLTIPITLAGIVIPGLIVLALTGSRTEGPEAAIWAGPVRIFFLNHTTWCINSICHTQGEQHFATRDRSTNRALLAFLALGEGWHNGHHAFPKSARHGLLPGQIDATYQVIRLLERFGVIRDVYVPTDERVQARRMRIG